MTPVISVLMPVYNAGPYLEEAIASVLDQTFSDFELLLFNDASTDNSAQIISSFSDQRIKSFSSEINQGHIFHLNAGLRLAKGEFIARMDADDVCMPERFEKQVAFLRHHPEVGVCGTLTTNINSNGEIIGHDVIETNDEALRLKLISNTCFSHPTVMMRKSILQRNQIEYSAELFPAEDYAIWTLLAVRTKFANIPQKLVQYRKHSNQVSSVKQKLLDGALQKVRKINLENFLGRASLPSEMETHQLLINGHVNASKDMIVSLAKWLTSLRDLNATSRYFNHEKFCAYLQRQWFFICTHNYSYGLWIVNIYNEYHFSGNVVGNVSKLKFLLKAIFRVSPFNRKPIGLTN
jgi:glycosyltransferase involved in cell wall biosynthesis